jgi:large subunit ribosomal protein L32
MAVPKKKLSKTRKNKRRSVWNLKISNQISTALFVVKSILNKKINNFVYPFINTNNL